MAAALLAGAAPAWARHKAKPSAADAGTADADDVKLVRLFLKLPTADLPEEAVPHFLEIDPETLPKKLREPYKGKRLELYTLKQMADNKKKGLIRSPDPACEQVQQAKSQDIAALRLAHYEEISVQDELCLEKQTHCTERGMMCEFSLQIVDEKKKKGKLRHYFLYPGDPLAVLLIPCRPGTKVGGNSNFFSAMKPSCTD